MHNRHFASLVATLFLFLSSHAPASPLQMFIFGDSLSDGGNMFALSGGLAPPSPPYAGVFSNGPVWVDQYADDRGLTTTNAYAAALGLDAPGGDITNLAVAGSYTGPRPYDFGVPLGVLPSRNALDPLTAPLVPPNGGPVFPGLQGPEIPAISPFPSQLELFIGLTGGVAPSDAIYAIWAGANDFIFADALAPAGTLATDLVSSAVANIETVIGDLAVLGAEHFLVFNMPDLGSTPFAALSQLADPPDGRKTELTDASNDFNQQLESMLLALELTTPAIEITRLDVNALFADLLANPVAAGFNDTDLGPAPPPLASCVDDFSNPPFRVDFCTPSFDPNERIFWDSVHPTSAVHAIIADAVKDAVVSEPPMVLLLAVSLIAFGAARNRRAA